MPGPKPAIEAFYEKIRIIPNGCWEWTGSKTPKGYGQTRLWRVTQAAHRCSYLFHIGPIPSGMLVCHKCDNPGCVRPDHLFIGTAEDNTSDMFAKHREGCRHGCFVKKLKHNDAVEIRRQYDMAPFISTRRGVIKAPGTLAQIAHQFGITSALVGAIGRGISWKQTLNKESV
jgi:hypothetical protein